MQWAFSKMSRLALESTQPRIQWVLWFFLSGCSGQSMKLTFHEHWPPSCAKFKNKWSYNSTPLYTHCIWTGTTLPFHTFYPLCIGIYMCMLWLIVWFLPLVYCSVSFNLRHSVSIRTKFGLCFLIVILIQQNSICLTWLGPNMRQIVEYSRLLDGTYTDPSFDR
jgi:hypothetical protein